MRRLLAIAGAVVCLSAPGRLFAQSMLGEPNSVSVSAGYTYAQGDKLIESGGMKISNVKVTHHVFDFGVTYVTPLEKLAIGVSLPLVGTKWDDSSFPHFPTAGEWDDGSTHFTATDLRADLHYQLLEEPLGVMLTVGGSVPTHDYPTYGYTAPGRGLKAAHLGATLARTFDPVLPNAFFSLAYEFSLVEKYDNSPGTDAFGQNYSDMSAQLGYFVGDSLEVHGALDATIFHGGIDFVNFALYSDEIQNDHDAVLKEQIWLLGGGANYQLTESMTIGLEARLFIAGKNTSNNSMVGANAEYSIAF